MRSIDVIIHDIASVRAESDLAEALKLLADRDPSPPPVVDAGQSRSDSPYRNRHPRALPRWLQAVMAGSTLAPEFAGPQGEKLGENATADVTRTRRIRRSLRDSNASA